MPAEASADVQETPESVGCPVGASVPWPGGQGDASSAWLPSAAVQGAVCAASARLQAAADMGSVAASRPFPQNHC